MVWAQGKAVGYVNLNVSPGYRLLSNPLSTANNLLSSVFSSSRPANGTTIQKWDPAALTLTPVSTYEEGVGWSIDYYFPPGEGVLFYSPASASLTFVGEVPQTLPQPIETPGTYLLSSVIPAVRPEAFMYATGREPLEGESVRRLDLASQTYYTTTFNNGTWDNGVPMLNVTEAAYFTLNPVPEPEAYVLFGLGLLLFLCCRSSRNRSANK